MFYCCVGEWADKDYGEKKGGIGEVDHWGRGNTGMGM